MAFQQQNVESLKAIATTEIEARIHHIQSTLAMIFQHQPHISAIITPRISINFEITKVAFGLYSGMGMTISEPTPKIYEMIPTFRTHLLKPNTLNAQ